MKKIKQILKNLFPSHDELMQRRFEKFMEGASDLREIEYRHYLCDRGYGHPKNHNFNGMKVHY